MIFPSLCSGDGDPNCLVPFGSPVSKSSVLTGADPFCQLVYDIVSRQACSGVCAMPLSLAILFSASTTGFKLRWQTLWGTTAPAGRI